MSVAVALGPGLWRVPTVPHDLVNSFLLRDPDGQLTVVDAGLRSAPPRLLSAIRSIGGHPENVTRIILTHAHSDHAGGAQRLRAATGAPVAIHQDDAAYARAGKCPPLDPAHWGGRLLRRGRGFAATTIDEELHDGQLLDVAGGLRVVHTPGHTPGHVSLLYEPTRLLITGDALFNWGSRIRWPMLGFCTDVARMKQSAMILAELDYDEVAFTHGPEIRENGREAVRGFLKTEGLLR